MAEKQINITNNKISSVESGNVIYDLLQAAGKDIINPHAFDSFDSIARNRNEINKLIDQMTQDSTISAVLETYAEDATTSNEEGRKIWATSENQNLANFLNFIIDSLELDTKVYSWIYYLLKYGDLYLKLFRKSDTEKANRALKEDITVNLTSEKDKYIYLVEQVKDTAPMFELTQFGKSAGFVKVDSNTLQSSRAYSALSSYNNLNSYYYKTYSGDVDVYQPTDFVHACLEGDVSKQQEYIDIYDSSKLEKNTCECTEEDDAEMEHTLYSVRSGQSFLYPIFDIWRQLSLLEKAILLSRLTRSALLRIAQVEVGDMPKEKAQEVLANLKRICEQEISVSTGAGMSEYVNPGPFENTVYLTKHNNIGAVEFQDVGGDTNVTGLDDLDYFRNKFFGALKIPKEYFGFNSEGATFDSGKSLSLISARYAKTVIKIQDIICNMVTSLMNLYLYDRGMVDSINNFTILMNKPVTQDSLDKQAALKDSFDMIDSFNRLIESIDDKKVKLKLTSSMLKNIGVSQDTLDILNQYIQEKEDAEKEQKQQEQEQLEDEYTANEDEDTNIEELPQFNFDSEPIDTEEGEVRL